jgi:hypothetical protein
VAAAVCIRCGAQKRRALSRCRGCGLDPRSDTDHVVRSIILSVERYEDGSDRRRYETELDSIGATIRAGGVVPYDQREIDELVRSLRMARTLPWWVPLKALAMVALLLAPLWIIIALAVWLYFHH